MNYKKRLIEPEIYKLLKIFPVVSITGPRQSGKTTLIKIISSKSKNWKYYNLDNREILLKIKEDPSLFTNSLNSNTAIDEAQKAPELFHSLKELVDSGFKHKIIISGSANFLLMKSITESLAGRVGILELLPFSVSEAISSSSKKIIKLMISSKDIINFKNKLARLKKTKQSDMLEFILRGGFPKVHELDKNQSSKWFESYISTYIEKDLRDLSQIVNLDSFQKVYKTLAFQTSNILNINNISSDLGIDSKTVKKYISLLESSYQCKLIYPFCMKANKQLVKRPKVHYLDTGLINYFYENHTNEQMLNGGEWGKILETFLFSELYKEIKDITPKPSINFWRTSNGAEVDFVIASGKNIYPIEVKSGFKINHYELRGIQSFMESYQNVPFGIVIYRGQEPILVDKKIIALPWNLAF
ncbi:MAG: ATP-binding protein [Candidatus Melainabacteria bacterium]|nr:ATP-binding protein [Candidatus Melainabacteria bacterium]